MPKRSTYYFSFFTLLGVLSGCDNKQDIQVYRVSKETAPPPSQAASGMQAMPGAGMPAENSGPALTSTPPAGWETQPPSSMRLASFLVKGENGAVADISLVMLGGPAGGGVENVNRWLTQIGQPALDEAKLAQIATHVPSPLGDVLLVDLEGLPSGGDPNKDGRILGGIISGEGKTIFFKMRGNAALAAAQKQNFIQWIATVRMEDPAKGAPATAAAMPSLPPMEPAAAGAPSAPADETAKPQLKWVVPEGWKSVAASTMRYASFAIAGPDGATADLSVSTFPGDVGGDLQNVNRWRGQVGLEPVTDIKQVVTSLSGKGGEFLVADMTGAQAHLVVGWIKKNGNTWFFKLLGPDSVVAAEKAKFSQFIQSTEF